MPNINIPHNPDADFGEDILPENTSEDRLNSIANNLDINIYRVPLPLTPEEKKQRTQETLDKYADMRSKFESVLSPEELATLDISIEGDKIHTLIWPPRHGGTVLVSFERGGKTQTITERWQWSENLEDRPPQDVSMVLYHRAEDIQDIVGDVNEEDSISDYSQYKQENEASAQHAALLRVVDKIKNPAINPPDSQESFDPNKEGLTVEELIQHFPGVQATLDELGFSETELASLLADTQYRMGGEDIVGGLFRAIAKVSYIPDGSTERVRSRAGDVYYGILERINEEDGEIDQREAVEGVLITALKVLRTVSTPMPGEILPPEEQGEPPQRPDEPPQQRPEEPPRQQPDEPPENPPKKDESLGDWLRRTGWSVGKKIGGLFGGGLDSPVTHAMETYEIATKADILMQSWHAKPLPTHISSDPEYFGVYERMDSLINAELNQVLREIQGIADIDSIYDILKLPFEVMSGVSKQQREAWKASIRMAEAAIEAQQQYADAVKNASSPEIKAALAEQYSEVLIAILSGGMADFAEINQRLETSIAILTATEKALQTIEEAAGILTSLHPGIGLGYALASNLVKVSTNQKTTDEATADILLSVVGGRIVGGIGRKGVAQLGKSAVGKEAIGSISAIITQIAQRVSRNPDSVKSLVGNLASELAAYAGSSELKELYASIEDELDFIA